MKYQIKIENSKTLKPKLVGKDAIYWLKRLRKLDIRSVTIVRAKTTSKRSHAG